MLLRPVHFFIQQSRQKEQRERRGPRERGGFSAGAAQRCLRLLVAGLFDHRPQEAIFQAVQLGLGRAARRSRELDYICFASTHNIWITPQGAFWFQPKLKCTLRAKSRFKICLISIHVLSFVPNAIPLTKNPRLPGQSWVHRKSSSKL